MVKESPASRSWRQVGPVVGSSNFQPVALRRTQTLGGYRADAYGGAWTVHWLVCDPEKDRARIAGSTPAPSRQQTREKEGCHGRFQQGSGN